MVHVHVHDQYHATDSTESHEATRNESVPLDLWVAAAMVQHFACQAAVRP